MVTQRILKRKKNSRHQSSGTFILRYFGFSTAPIGSTRGPQRQGKILAEPFFHCNSILRGVNGFEVLQITIKPHSLRIETLSSNLSPKLEQ